MRPNKPINSGAHHRGPAGGKNRYFTTGLPEPEESAEEESVRRLELPDSVLLESRETAISKYAGRGTVGPRHDDEPDGAVDLNHEDWVDPLDADEEVDLTTIEIDLRTTMRHDAPDTYYQRFGTRVPGHK